MLQIVYNIIKKLIRKRTRTTTSRQNYNLKLNARVVLILWNYVLASTVYTISVNSVTFIFTPTIMIRGTSKRILAVTARGK